MKLISCIGDKKNIGCFNYIYPDRSKWGLCGSIYYWLDCYLISIKRLFHRILISFSSLNRVNIHFSSLLREDEGVSEMINIREEIDITLMDPVDPLVPLEKNQFLNCY